MAFRYIMSGSMQGVRTARGRVTLPVYKRAARVESRSGADVRKLALQVLSHPSCEIDAAVGSGESELLPKELALASGKLVIHVFPNRLLALDVYRYVEKQALAAPDLYPPLVFVESGSVEVPRQGVAYVGVVDLVNRVLRLGASVLKDTVVYLDDTHESNAYVGMIRVLARVADAGLLVVASATSGPSNFRVRESLGSVNVATYPSDLTPETWNISGGSRSWKVKKKEIDDDLSVFVDSCTQVATLHGLRADSSFDVHGLGMSLGVVHRRESGDAVTAFGNALLNVLSVGCAYGGTPVTWALFMSDDSLICTQGVVAKCEPVTLMAEAFNLTVGSRVADAPCHASVFLAIDGVSGMEAFVPDPDNGKECSSVRVSIADPLWEDRYRGCEDASGPYAAAKRVAGLARCATQQYEVHE